MSITSAEPDALLLSAENALSLADEPVPVLRDRLVTALRYTISWLDAVKGASPISAISWAGKIHDLQTEILGVLAIMPPDSQFAGNDAKTAYEATSAHYAALYRDLVFSADSLPQPALLDQLGSFASALLEFPSVAVSGAADAVTNAIAKTLGGTLAAVWRNLWPFLLIAGGVGLVYVFRAPLGRAVGKVAA